MKITFLGCSANLGADSRYTVMGINQKQTSGLPKQDLTRFLVRYPDKSKINFTG